MSEYRRIFKVFAQKFQPRESHSDPPTALEQEFFSGVRETLRDTPWTW